MDPLTQHHIDLLALCRVKGLSWFLVAREARRADGVARLLRADLDEQSKEARAARELLRNAAEELDAARGDVARILDEAGRTDFRLTTVLDDDYPLNLRTIFNAPPFLFYRGRLDPEADARSVAVVGTRGASAEGLKRARKMARLLVENGVTVLSGLARGVDTAAHTASLDAGGRTVAVLGSGLRRIYPPENVGLAARIAESGALVSQFFPDAEPTKHSFPLRNITMSGMGQGTVVIEAGSTSGAKMQARLALEHGKKVFLISHLVATQPWAKKYLARGAIQVDQVDEIVAALRSTDDVRARARDTDQLALGLD
jgi:DNA processing protein